MEKPRKQSDRKEKDSFLMLYEKLPAVMQKRFIKQMGIGIVLAAFMTLIIIKLKHPTYILGYLAVLYVVYTGFDLVWKYHDGKIICKKMVCITANASIKKDRIDAMFQELDETTAPENATHRFKFGVSKQDIRMISEGTVMNIYYRPDVPLSVIAWEIVGNTNVQKSRT